MFCNLEHEVRDLFGPFCDLEAPLVFLSTNYSTSIFSSLIRLGLEFCLVVSQLRVFIE